MLEKSKIEEIASRYADSKGLFVVEIKISGANDVEVIVDSMERVCLDQCAEVSKLMQAEIDTFCDDYSLMVASAGIGSNLVDGRQIQKTVGKPISVVLKSGSKIVGELVAFDNQKNEIEVEFTEKVAVEGKKRKEEVLTKRVINVDETKSIIEELKIK